MPIAKEQLKMSELNELGKMVEITESAKNKVVDLLLEENNPNLMLRTFVQGGGCSGFSYGFTFDEIKNEDDFEFPIGTEYNMVIDAMSMQYLQGAKIDYQEDITGSQFVIKNPNAQSTCGCGSSFSV
jgi:iron-sulfur cluster insertion protein